MYSVTDRYSTGSNKFTHVTVSAAGDGSCQFDDVDICGYEDLSPTGNWSQIHNQSEYTFNPCTTTFIMCVGLA